MSSFNSFNDRNETITPDMKFAEAAALWMKLKAPVASDGGRLGGYIRMNTVHDYQRRLKSLGLFFSATRLCDIRLDHLAEYQRLRVQGADPFIRHRRPHDKELSPCSAKPQQINQELSILIRILKRVGLWDETKDRLYEPMIGDIAEMPRALTPEEQRRWIDVSRSHPRWNVIHWYSLLAFDTCMSTNEIRGLRLGDINLQQQIIRVPREAAKNAHRHRDILISSPEAMWALEALVQRAQQLGAQQPQHYIFPFKITRSKLCMLDRQMTTSGLKKLWDEVRKASGLDWFRMYDTRHTAITRFVEGGVPLLTIMKRAGHVSAKMTEHYTHISDRSQLHSLRMAQQYNGGLGMDPSAVWNESTTRYCTPRTRMPVRIAGTTKEPQPQELIHHFLRAMQEQLGLTPEQLRQTILAGRG